MHFHEWKVWISINISLKFVPKAPVNNSPALVQIMAWHRPVYGCIYQRSRLRRPISKIRMILLMDAKISIVTKIIMFAVRPICTQDAIFKMSSVSPDIYTTQLQWCNRLWAWWRPSTYVLFFFLYTASAWVPWLTCGVLSCNMSAQHSKLSSEAHTRWPPFCRWHCKIHFLKWKLLNLK